MDTLMLRRENYITIQGFMVKDLELKGNELILYALIYGFTQDGETEFTGSIRYMCEWTNSSRPTVASALSSLVKKGLIEKRTETTNGVTFNRYKVSCRGVKNLYGGSKESLQGVVKNLYRGGKDSLHNNIEYNNRYNIEDNIYISASEKNSSESVQDIIPESKKTKKHKYGEYKHVLLTDEEYDKLNTDYGKGTADLYIRKVDEYCEMKGKSYKNYNLAVRNFIRRDNVNPQQVRAEHKADDYDLSSLFEV